MAAEQKYEEKSDFQKLLEEYIKLPLVRVSSEDLQVGDLFFLREIAHTPPARNDVSLNIVTDKRNNTIDTRTILGLKIDTAKGQILTLEDIKHYESGHNSFYFIAENPIEAYKLPIKIKFLVKPYQITIEK